MTIPGFMTELCNKLFKYTTKPTMELGCE